MSHITTFDDNNFGFFVKIKISCQNQVMKNQQLLHDQSHHQHYQNIHHHSVRQIVTGMNSVQGLKLIELNVKRCENLLRWQYICCLFDFFCLFFDVIVLFVLNDKYSKRFFFCIYECIHYLVQNRCSFWHNNLCMLYICCTGFVLYSQCFFIYVFCIDILNSVIANFLRYYPCTKSISTNLNGCLIFILFSYNLISPLNTFITLIWKKENTQRKSNSNFDDWISKSTWI